MIQIKNINLNINNSKILNNINLNFELGKNYILAGKNGSGKSSLAFLLAGHPNYNNFTGKIDIEGKDFSSLDVSELSDLGIFLSFQNIPEIPGINLGVYLRTIYNNHLKRTGKNDKGISPFIFKRFIKKFLEELQIDEKFLDRDLNVGFSGGEKRKIEMLQIKLLEPKYIIFDEIDSGLDINALDLITDKIGDLNNSNNTIIIITHNFKLIEKLNNYKTIILKDGEIVDKGGKELVEKIKNNGYEY